MIEIVKANAGPFVFLVIAGALCMLLPIEKRAEAIYLVIGAALTRVKRVDSRPANDQVQPAAGNQGQGHTEAQEKP